MSTACAVMMTWCDLWHLIPEVKVTSCFPVPVLPICSSLMLVYVTTSSFDTCSVGRCWRWRWMQICPNKTVVIGNKSVIHTSYSSDLYFQLKEGCALRALIHKAPSTWHRVSLLFPCPLETGHKGKSILLHDVSVNSLHRIFTDDEVQRSPSCCRPSTSHEWVSAQVESLHHLASSLTCPPFPPSTGTGGRVFNRFGAKWVLEKAIYPGM